jgi:glycerol kinase
VADPGITRGTTRAHIVRAALESIAYQTRDLVGALADATGTALSELRVDGGACRNDFLMQFQADLLGCPVNRANTLESTAMGAAFLADPARILMADDPPRCGSRRRSFAQMSDEDRERCSKMVRGGRAGKSR